MTEDYATNTQGIKDGLIATIKAGTTSFTTHVYADYIKKIPSNPVALVRLRRDRMRSSGAKETEHHLILEIWVQYRGDYTETTLNSMIGYVGEIVDAIEATRNLGYGTDVDAEVVDIDYSFREDKSAILHTSNIQVDIRHMRNV